MATIRSRKRFRAVIVLLVVFVLLLGVFFQTKPSDDDEEKSSRALLSTSAEDIQEIIISAAGRETIRLKRDGETWALVEPIEAKADEAAVTAITDVTDSVIGVPVSEDTPEDLASHGLNSDSSLTFALVDAEGQREEVVLGNTIPLDVGYVYTLDGDSEGLFKVYKDFKEIVDQTVYDVRSKSITDVDPDTVATIEIEHASGRTLLRRSGDWWRIEAPEEQPADMNAVSELLSTLASLEAVDFPTEVPEPKSASSGENGVPAQTVRLTDADGNSTSINLETTYGDGLVAVTTDADEYVRGVPADSLFGAPFSQSALVAQTALRFIPERIVEVTVERDGEAFELQREDGEWWVVRPDRQRARDGTVSYALQRLSRVEVSDVRETEREGVDGINPVEEGNIHVALFEEDGTAHQMWLLTGDAESGTQSSVNAADATPVETPLGVSTFRDGLFEVERSALGDLPVSAQSVVDRRLLSFSARDVGRLEIRTSETTLRLEKRDGDWFVTKPERTRADQSSVWGAVFALEKAQYTDVLEDDGDPEQVRREHANSITVELWNEDGDSIGTISGAAQSGDEGTAKMATSAREGVYAVSDAVVKQIPRRVEDVEFRR